MADHGYEFIETAGKPIKAWTRGVLFEDEARAQLARCAQLPFVFKHVAVMPDVHGGIGATVGSVVATQGAIVPSAVGVDIGCGMMAVQTNLSANDLPDNLSGVRSAIEAAVPHGRTDNGGRNDRGAWSNPPDVISNMYFHGNSHTPSLSDRFQAIRETHPRLEKANTVRHLGTLGTGNHFIEVCLDESNRVWVMLHSGSRGIGNAIGQRFIELAKRDMERWFIQLPDSDLAYLPEGSEHYDDYIEAVEWAQDFAAENRAMMMYNTLKAMSKVLGRDVEPDRSQPVAIQCHHNYVAREHHFGRNVIVTRKGAVRAREGDLCIIPGSMGTRSYIARGKGNPESFCSCSHGAGRVMSRTEAKKRFTLDDHARAVEGVECRRDEGVLDETPQAYKAIDAVMAAQADLVEVVHTLKQVVCVKG